MVVIGAVTGFILSKTVTPLAYEARLTVSIEYLGIGKGDNDSRLPMQYITLGLHTLMYCIPPNPHQSCPFITTRFVIIGN